MRGGWLEIVSGADGEGDEEILSPSPRMQHRLCRKVTSTPPPPPPDIFRAEMRLIWV